MTIRQWLEFATDKLKANECTDTPRLDAEILLADTLEKERFWLIAHDETLISDTQQKQLAYKLRRRLSHEPIAYIRGVQEFYGRQFYVDKTVLIPRPESESLIELFTELHLPKHAEVADIGCGSGALGVTAWLERPDIYISFLDIDPRVFTIVKKNARLHAVRHQQYYSGDLLDAWAQPYDVLLANLPYVPTDYRVNSSAMKEPALALYSGADGLDHYRKLFSQLKSGTYGVPAVITESFPSQHDELKNIARDSGWNLQRTHGFAQLFLPE